MKITIEKGIITNIENLSRDVELVIDGIQEIYHNAFVYPSFSDSHGHITGFGIQNSITNLNPAKSAEECAELIKYSPSMRGGWIYARGWNNELWQNKELPDLKVLDYYFPDTPCYLVRVDGHAAWVNSKALEIAEVNASTSEPSGGSVIKLNNGKPSGMLVDNAMELVYPLIPKYSRNQIREMILNACNILRRSGLTEIHDMDMDPGLIDIFSELDDKGMLPLRVNAFIKAQNDEWLKSNILPQQGKKFNVCGLKFYADGALGSRGAALFEPYSDAPDTKGLLLITSDELYRKTLTGVENGFQIAVHAIGDAANSMVADVFAKIRTIGYRNSILRIEHAQHVQANTINTIAENNIYCSVQPVHCISDKEMALKRLGGRVSYSYPWKTLLNNGILLAGGSDFPIESHNPILGIHAFVNRIPFNDSKPWYPNECLSINEAIEAYTTTPKIISGNINPEIGLEIGKKADFIVLNNNLKELTSISPDSYLVLKVVSY